LESHVREDLAPIAADRQRIVQVLGNLVSNAIQCTSGGGRVAIRTEAIGQEVRFAVADTGCGIPQDQLPHVFDRYKRVRASGDGIGLGLSIARGIVESHGGRIWVESQVGEGSTFYFTIPLADASTASSGSSEEETAYEAIAVIAGPSVRRAATPQPEDPEQVALERRESTERQKRFASSADKVTPVTDSDRSIVDRLRAQIQAALYLGDLIPGDRLPSIREMAGKLDVTHYAVVRAYEALAAEGLVERRDRSGIYVAPQQRLGEGPIGETAGWISQVLTESWEHQIKFSLLPQLLQRSIAAARLHCACVESDADTLAALCTDVEQYFAVETSALSPDSFPVPHPGEMIDEESVPPEIRGADVLLTTTFHASAVRAVAEALGKPVVVATANPDHVETIEQRARDGGVTVVCLDPAYGERVRGLRGGRYRDRIRVVLAEDAPAVEALDADAPVLLTRAAHQRIGRSDLRLLVPFSPCFSRPCAQALTEILVRLNVDAARQHIGAGRASS
ncbi:MAG TPA: ATP-binding protein, partial [Longimicrobiaceae bacterium]|nr:ATP-binding protein [Longimicrobiaceae bacterium]